eukprot:887007-Prorocentrum_minimum.AAC.2
MPFTPGGFDSFADYLRTRPGLWRFVSRRAELLVHVVQREVIQRPCALQLSAHIGEDLLLLRIPPPRPNTRPCQRLRALSAVVLVRTVLIEGAPHTKCVPPHPSQG